MIKELMFERLRKIENLEQRQLLKDIINGVFVNLIDYQAEMNKKLEERIFNEMDYFENKYDIYGALSTKENVDPIHDFLFPLIPADVEDHTISLDNLLAARRHREPMILTTIFLECDAIEIQHLLAQQRLFAGKLITSQGLVDIRLRLMRNNRYMQKIMELSAIFKINGLPWKTVNHPFASKFLDVVLVDCPPINEDSEIMEVKIDLEEYDDKKRLNMVPLWNIQRHEMKNSGFPFPAIDKVNYEHVLSLRKTGNQHGYLIDAKEENIRYVKRSDNELTIVSPQDQSGVWQLLKIAKVEKERIGKLCYYLVSNRRHEHFMHKLSHKYNANITTKGEISRLINSFEAADRLELVMIDIVEEYPESHGIVHPLFSETIGEHSHKKVMLLQFRARQAKDFIANDIVSFLITEVQRYFTQYKCVGKWL